LGGDEGTGAASGELCFCEADPVVPCLVASAFTHRLLAVRATGTDEVAGDPGILFAVGGKKAWDCWMGIVSDERSSSLP